MNKFFKLCLAPFMATAMLCIFGLGLSSVYADVITGKCGDNLTYTINEERTTVTITGTGVMYNYTYSNNTCTSPFYEYRNTLTTLVLQEDITSIGDYAFVDCEYLTGKLNLPTTVTKIGKSAFGSCSFTDKLEIPASVTYIDSGAFYHCDFTGSLEIPASVTYIGNDAFNSCDKLTGNLDIPDTVTYVGIDAFDCTNLDIATGRCGDSLSYLICNNYTKVIISGKGAMYDYTYGNNTCTSPFYEYRNTLTTLVLQEGITSIGDYAFVDCEYLTGKLNLPTAVTKIGKSAFGSCSFTDKLEIPASVTYIDSGAFYHCDFTGSLEIPASVTYIGNDAFNSCDKLTGNLDIPDTVTYVGIDAFDCTNLDIATGRCGDSVVSYLICNNYTKAILSGGGTMYDYTYSDNNTCTSPFYEYRNTLTTLVLQEGITSIGDYAFYMCESLTGQLTLPATVTKIGTSAFENCAFTGRLSIPDTVTHIGDSAFWNCSGFTDKLVIPNSVTYIGDGAFCNCSGLTDSLIIPSSVTNIGRIAFDLCQFTDITVLNKEAAIGEGAIYNTKLRCFKNSTADSYALDANSTRVYIQEQGNLSILIQKPSDGKWIQKVELAVDKGGSSSVYDLTKYTEDNENYIFPVFMYADSYLGDEQALLYEISCYYSYDQGEASEEALQGALDAALDTGVNENTAQVYCQKNEQKSVSFELKEVQ